MMKWLQDFLNKQYQVSISFELPQTTTKIILNPMTKTELDNEIRRITETAAQEYLILAWRLKHDKEYQDLMDKTIKNGIKPETIKNHQRLLLKKAETALPGFKERLFFGIQKGIYSELVAINDTTTPTSKRTSRGTQAKSKRT